MAKIVTKKVVAESQPDKNKYKGKGALDAFLNLLSLISLGWTSWAIGAIAFELIYRYTEMQSKLVNINNYSDQGIKYAIASLLVIGPVYFLAVNLLHRRYKTDELNHNSGIYRWLTYLMLLASALSIVGSLIALIASFLNGDYSLSIVLDILVVMIIALFIFGYYFYDLKRKDYKKVDQVSAIVGGVVVVVLVVAVVLGFLNVETPAKTRARLLDSRTENALSNLVMSVANDYSLNNKVPDQISNLAEWVSPGKDISVVSVTYRKINDQNFELCADFNSASASKFNVTTDMPWAGHPVGNACYNIDAAQALTRYYGTDYKGGVTTPVVTPAPVVSSTTTTSTKK